MHNILSLDLKVARKKSGLTQADVGHLIGGNNLTLSHIERGKRIASIRELCALSLIYGRSFDNFYAELLADIREELSRNLESLPELDTPSGASSLRQNTLNRLASDLTDYVQNG